MQNQYQNNSKKPEHCEKCKKHVHEITGSTAIFSECSDCHNHRFTTVSGEEIRKGDTHVHEIKFHTDFSDGHFHEFCGTSGPAIYIDNGKHIHFASACTEECDGHKHKFQVASLIDSPTDFKKKCN